MSHLITTNNDLHWQPHHKHVHDGKHHERRHDKEKQINFDFVDEARREKKLPGAPQSESANRASLETESYTFKPGDTLSKLAKDRLGDANKWHDIYDLNKSTVKNPHKIRDGQVLMVPKLQTGAEKALPTVHIEPESKDALVSASPDEKALANGLTLPRNMDHQDLQYTLQMRRLLQAGCAVAKNVTDPQLVSDAIDGKVIPRWEQFKANMKGSTFGLDLTPEFTCMLAAARSETMLKELSESK